MRGLGQENPAIEELIYPISKDKVRKTLIFVVRFR